MMTRRASEVPDGLERRASDSPKSIEWLDCVLEQRGEQPWLAGRFDIRFGLDREMIDRFAVAVGRGSRGDTRPESVKGLGR